jgi:hypothetical protein
VPEQDDPWNVTMKLDEHTLQPLYPPAEEDIED